MTISTEITTTQLGRIVEEASSEVYLFCADDFRFLMVNRGARKNLGFSMEYLGRLAPWDIKPEFTREQFLELIGPLASGATDLLDFETVHERSDGTRYDVSVRLQLMQTEVKSVYYAAVRDISELRQTQEALLESNSRLDAILSNTTMAVFIMDERHHCAYMNAAAEQMTGFTLPETQGKTLHEVIHHTHPDGRHFPIEECVIDRAFPDNDQTQGEAIFVHKDGSFYPVGFTASPLKDKRGTPIGTIIEVRNIATELEARKTEERLREAQKLETIGHLTGGVAHDFNNLLTIILGNAEMLSESVTDPKLRHMAEMTLFAAERGAELTNRLLAFARRKPLNPKPTQINHLLEGMRDLVHRTMPENIEIEFLPDSDLGVVEIDAAELDNAVLNLVINARDAMPEGGKLTIETINTVLDNDYARRHSEVVPGEYVMICVSDTGMGMNPETASRAFEPFFSTKKMGEGTGLGLSMVFGFTKQSGGHIKIYSELGEGTSVKLYFPRIAAETQPSDWPADKVPLQGGTEHILVVEDDELVLKHLEGQLLSLGYRVVTAKSGLDALSVLEKQSDFDLLLTDVVMPGGMNGRELADRTRKTFPSLRVLFTSGYTENAIVHHGRLDQDAELLSKPYTRLKLAAKVRAVLDKDMK